MAHRTLLCGLFVTFAGSYAALATNDVADAWAARYPFSTLPARMQEQTGSSCNVCHHAGPGVQGNCYREDLTALFQQGSTPEEAIALLDTEDSDLDGVPNGVEIMTVRQDDPGNIGYNPGLVGDTGTDPCGVDINEVVTGVPETPAPPPVPAVSEWGLTGMTLLLLVFGSVVITRRRPAV